MKLPRDISGEDLIGRLKILEYKVTRQTGSHIRLTTLLDGEKHITIPHHKQLKVGTLAAIISSLVEHHGIERDDLLERLFRK